MATLHIAAAPNTTVIEVLADDLTRAEVSVRFPYGEWTTEGLEATRHRFERAGLTASTWIDGVGSATVVGVSRAEAERRLRATR